MFEVIKIKGRTVNRTSRISAVLTRVDKSLKLVKGSPENLYEACLNDDTNLLNGLDEVCIETSLCAEAHERPD